MLPLASSVQIRCCRRMGIGAAVADMCAALHRRGSDYAKVVTKYCGASRL